MGLQRIPWALSGNGGAIENAMYLFMGEAGGGGGGLKKRQDRGGGLSEETIAFIHFGGP